MPWNIKQNDTADFSVRFRDRFGTEYTPSSAWVSLTYLISGVSNSSSITLTLSGGNWVGSWSSAGVDCPSDVSFLVLSSCAGAKSDALRIIDP